MDIRAFLTVNGRGCYHGARRSSLSVWQTADVVVFHKVTTIGFTENGPMVGDCGKTLVGDRLNARRNLIYHWFPSSSQGLPERDGGEVSNTTYPNVVNSQKD